MRTVIRFLVSFVLLVAPTITLAKSSDVSIQADDVSLSALEASKGPIFIAACHTKGWGGPMSYAEISIGAKIYLVELSATRFSTMGGIDYASKENTEWDMPGGVWTHETLNRIVTAIDSSNWRLVRKPSKNLVILTIRNMGHRTGCNDGNRVWDAKW